jgi:hypothetical protein
MIYLFFFFLQISTSKDQKELFKLKLQDLTEIYFMYQWVISDLQVNLWVLWIGTNKNKIYQTMFSTDLLHQILLKSIT